MQTVYVDILIFLNTVIDYLLLSVTAAAAGKKVYRRRMIAAAFIGGVYSLILLLPQLSGPVLTVSRLLSSALITAVAFSFRSLRAFLYQWGLFYLTGFLFAGAMTALWFILLPQRMLLSNGVVYIHLQPAVLIAGVLVIHLAVKLFFARLQKTPGDRLCFSVTLYAKGRSIGGIGVMDTGNRLTDPFDASPVILCRSAFLQPILPEAVSAYLTGRCSLEQALAQKVRFIPYQGVNSSGLLPVVCLDRIEISENKRRSVCEKVKAAVVDQPLFAEGCSVLLHPALVFSEEGSAGKGGEKDENRMAAADRRPDQRLFDRRKPGFLHQRTGKSSGSADKGRGESGLGEDKDRSVSKGSADRT